VSGVFVLLISEKRKPVKSSHNREQLVSCSISPEKHKDSCESFLVYPKSVKVVRPSYGYHKAPIIPDRTNTQLQGFSNKSKSRLRFLAANSADHISSQFCLTYADYWPINGREAKKQLNRFLEKLRYRFPDIKYIWVGEFQTRGAPHFHLFSNIPVTEENRFILGDAWHKIAGVSIEKHKKFHIHEKNFIPWDMGNGAYLCKYLDKAHQKQIPEGFSAFGRWWGNSSNLKLTPEEVSRQELDLFISDATDQETGEIFVDSAPQYLVRTLIKYQKKNNRSKWAVKRNQTMTVLTGAGVFNQTLSYLESQSKGRFKK